MGGDAQDGLASVVMLVYGLLWWGGALGCLALVLTSAQTARGQRQGRVSPNPPLSEHDRRVQELRRDLAHAPRPGPGAGSSAGSSAATVQPSGQQSGAALTTEPTTDLLVLGATFSAATAGVHLAMAPLHLADGLLHVAFFLAVGLTQAVQAARLLLRPTQGLLLAVALLNVTVLLIWMASRTVGVLGTTEAVGAWDLSAAVWEVACVVLALRLGTRVLRPPRLEPSTWSPLVLIAAALTLLTLVLLPLGGH